MLTYLRKIRRSLIESGSTRKYLLYAIGEIALVVIGILIALQINNWNERRKNDVLAKEYFCRLLEDAEQDRDQLENLMLVAQKRLTASNQAVRLLQMDKTLKVEIGIQMNLSVRGMYAYFLANDSAFEDLKSGANLNIIKDKAIIKSLNNYFNRIEGYRNILKSNVDNALRRYFVYDDLFATGWVHGHMVMNRLQDGMDQDVYDAVEINTADFLDNDTKQKLYNDAIYFISVNARRIEIYNLVNNEIEILIDTLNDKCNH